MLHSTYYLSRDQTKLLIDSLILGTLYTKINFVSKTGSNKMTTSLYFISYKNTIVPIKLQSGKSYIVKIKNDVIIKIK